MKKSLVLFVLLAGFVGCGGTKQTVSEKISLDAKKGTAKSNWEKVALAGIQSSMKRRGLIK